MSVENEISVPPGAGEQESVKPRLRLSAANAAIMLLPVAGLCLDLAVNLLLPNRQELFAASPTRLFSMLLKVGLVFYGILLAVSARDSNIKSCVRNVAPLLFGILLVFGVWDLLTARLALFKLPYFPGPDKVLDVYRTDWKDLIVHTLHSLRLLFSGYLAGTICGLVTGVTIGWSDRASYWLTPAIKVIGPIPATAWIPVALTVFPTSFWASVFLITLAVWFPVTIMTMSGIRNVQKSYFEVARTLGAGERHLVFRVAIPAALPFVFIGLFMGMGTAFLTLIVAEMLGVKAGLGFYISWAQEFADYSKVYAALAIVALIFSGIISLIFKTRDRILVWQKGVIKW